VEAREAFFTLSLEETLALAETPALSARVETPASLALAETPALLARVETPASLALAETPALLARVETPTLLVLVETPALLALAETPAPRCPGVSARLPAGKRQIRNVVVVLSIKRA
jgi:hypothetical protein